MEDLPEGVTRKKNGKSLENAWRKCHLVVTLKLAMSLMHSGVRRKLLIYTTKVIYMSSYIRLRLSVANTGTGSILCSGLPGGPTRSYNA